MKNNKYVHQLSKRFVSKNSAWLDKNILSPDQLTLTLFANSPNNSLFATLKKIQLQGYNCPITISDSTELNLNMTVEEFTEALKGQVDDKVLNELIAFSKQPTILVQGKSIVSVLWSNIVYNNYTNTNTEYNDELMNLLFLVIGKDTLAATKVTVGELTEETQTIFLDESKINDYFNLTRIEIQDSSIWYDYSTFPALEAEGMNEDLVINNDEEMFEALKDFKNLPSVLAYVKETYLQETDPKAEGYCKDDLIREYKALSMVLRFTEDARYKEDPNFDKNNNIGFNLYAKLVATEELIEQEHPNYRNSEVFTGFKTQSRKLAASVLGVAPRKNGDYVVFNKILDKYIDVCDFVLDHIEDHKVELQDYLRKLGVLKPKARVEKENTEVLIEKVEKLRTQASELQRSLKSKNVPVPEKVKSNKRIKDAKEVSEELETFKTLKSTKPYRLLKPAKAVATIVTSDRTPHLFNFVEVSKLQPARKKLKEPAGPVQEAIPLPDENDDEKENEDE